MKAKRRHARDVTKADLVRGMRHLTRAVHQLTDSYHLLRLQVQTALVKAKQLDER